MGDKAYAAHIFIITPISETGVREIWLTDTLQILRRTVIADDNLEVSICLPLYATKHIVKELAFIGGEKEGVFCVCHYYLYNMSTIRFFVTYIMPTKSSFQPSYGLDEKITEFIRI